MILNTIISLFVLLFAITIHEASHGWAAAKFGDFTARSMGRVSLNPVAHIDPVGTVLLPLLLAITRLPVFGWAKPVPVNPFNLRNPRRDNLWISAAGPAANLSAAAVCLISIVVLRLIDPGIVVFLGNYLSGWGSLPRGFHPLEGLVLILFFGVQINTYLAVFNLIPIPPLDGSGVLMGLLSDEAAERYDRLRPFGFIIVMALIYMGLLQVIIRPIELFILKIIFV
jgi:Zn-dependent protease